ncbi:MAG: class I SAM-dependent methyltransferase [Verrucomicrobiaceae bacterium]|nr:class I SAM-dependent methyltransferase [Verrucomicrobiaceae bacterium]
MKQETRDWYDTPLYYDIIYDADTREEAALLEHVFARHATPGNTRRMLEPACGSGRLVIEMARRGWSVSGFDGSAKMLGFARERLAKAKLNARLWEGWMQSFEVPTHDEARWSPAFRRPGRSAGSKSFLYEDSDACARTNEHSGTAGLDRLKAGLQRASSAQSSVEVPASASQAARSESSFDLIHCLINTFRYLLTEADAVSFLQRVSAALRPGGLFVLGLHLTDYERTSCEHERWVMDRKGVHVVCNTRTWPADRRRRIEKLRTRLVITHKGRTHRQETVWDYRTYDAAQLKRLLRTAAPELEVIACHDFTYDPAATRNLDNEYSHLVVTLRKKK